MNNILYSMLMSGRHGLMALWDYVSAHVINCLVPALLIAGAIGVFLRKDVILKFFGADVKKIVAYPVAAISGTVLAVCSCTILPLFAGLHRKGGGIGPAIAFLYSGPAINILAIIYTAEVLGWKLGVARAISAVAMAMVLGLLMASIFGNKKKRASSRIKTGDLTKEFRVGDRKERSWRGPIFLILLFGILIAGTSRIGLELKLAFLGFLIAGTIVLLWVYFSRDEVEEWGFEVWDLGKKILPLLILGTFIIGVISYYLPPETFRPLLGNNSLFSNLFGAVVGALLYMPTLLEVPVIGTTFGYTGGHMAQGPALALLLAGPAISLPNIIVLGRIIGVKKTFTYVSGVVLVSTFSGFVYGNI